MKNNSNFSNITNENIYSFGLDPTLIIACKKSMDKVALRILNCIGTQLKLNYKDSFGKTALNYATQNGLKRVALKILEINK